MALSGPIPMKVRVEGVPAALHILRSVPQGIVSPTLQDTLDEIVELGIDLMSINVLNTIRTDKSMGVLAESIQGDWSKTGGAPNELGGKYEMEIGSALPYAKYAAREIGLSIINRNVLIQPGKWRWIGVRGPIPRHPFLEQTMLDLHKVLPSMLNGHFTSYMGHIQAEADAMQLFSWLESPP